MPKTITEPKTTRVRMYHMHTFVASTCMHVIHPVMVLDISTLTLNISTETRFQNVLPCRHPCHTGDLELGTPCKVVSPSFHALNS